MPSTNSVTHSTESSTASTANSAATLARAPLINRLPLANLSDKQKAWLLIGALFVIILFWDILARLNVSSEAYSSKHELQGIVTAQHSLLDKHTQETINKLYANFDLPEPEVMPEADKKQDKPKPGMSEEEQLAQQGELDKLFIDDNSYQLSGIFWDKQYFAVLIKTDVNTATPEEIKVAQGQAFGSYIIESIAKQQITFVNGERTITLSMFR